MTSSCRIEFGPPKRIPCLPKITISPTTAKHAFGNMETRGSCMLTFCQIRRVVCVAEDLLQFVLFLFFIHVFLFRLEKVRKVREGWKGSEKGRRLPLQGGSGEAFRRRVELFSHGIPDNQGPTVEIQSRSKCEKQGSLTWITMSIGRQHVGETDWVLEASHFHEHPLVCSEDWMDHF